MRRQKKIEAGRLDGIVTDVHIYENTYDDAQDVILRYLDNTDKENFDNGTSTH